MELVRQAWREQGFSEQIVELLLAGNRQNTQSTYDSAWRNWCEWCLRRDVNPLSATLAAVLGFLTHLHSTGKAYNTVNVHRSMISKTLPLLDGLPVGVHPLVKKLMSACYNLNPPKPRYESTWDTDVVIKFVKESDEDVGLSLATLSQKTVTLLALASFLRVGELASIDFRSVSFSDGRVRFSLLSARKAQHDGPLQSFVLEELPDEKSCPVRALRAYVDRTAVRRNGVNINSLFISLRSPFAAVKPSSISRWIKTFLTAAGVDTSVFGAHSTRGAGASKATANGVSIDSVLRAGHWARESTFRRFYHREVEPSVASEVLRQRT